MSCPAERGLAQKRTLLRGVYQTATKTQDQIIAGGYVDNQMIGMCGAYCGACDWREKTQCPGCQAAQSHMFWGQCSVAKCAISKGLLHCGLCPELPCETLQGYFDHPEHGDRGERLANLKAWASGDMTYVQLRGLNEEDGQHGS